METRVLHGLVYDVHPQDKAQRAILCSYCLISLQYKKFINIFIEFTYEIQS
jgi:hypothetical protein